MAGEPEPPESPSRSAAPLPPPPPRAEATEPSAPIPDPQQLERAADADRRFAQALRDAGLAAELELDALAPGGLASAERRRLDLLAHYYTGEAGDERRRADRFALFDDEERLDASAVVDRLRALGTEAPQARLDRIGSSDGPLVMRAAGLVRPVVDEYEEAMETNEIDLRDLDERVTVSVRSLVRAFNGLLSALEVPWRFVDLPSDGGREAFVGISEAAAERLCALGCLEERDFDRVRDIAEW